MALDLPVSLARAFCVYCIRAVSVTSRNCVSIMNVHTIYDIMPKYILYTVAVNLYPCPLRDHQNQRGSRLRRRRH